MSFMILHSWYLALKKGYYLCCLTGGSVVEAVFLPAIFHVGCTLTESCDTSHTLMSIWWFLETPHKHTDYCLGIYELSAIWKVKSADVIYLMVKICISFNNQCIIGQLQCSKGNNIGATFPSILGFQYSDILFFLSLISL